MQNALIFTKFQVEIALCDFVDMTIDSPSKLAEVCSYKTSTNWKFQLIYVQLLMRLIWHCMILTPLSWGNYKQNSWCFNCLVCHFLTGNLLHNTWAKSSMSASLFRTKLNCQSLKSITSKDGSQILTIWELGVICLWEHNEVLTRDFNVTLQRQLTVAQKAG